MRTFSYSLDLTTQTARQVLKRQLDSHVLPFLNILLTYLLSLASTNIEDNLKNVVLDAMPWTAVQVYLTSMKLLYPPRFTVAKLSQFTNLSDLGAKVQRPRLPEDESIRGQVWCQIYFPDNWFDGIHVDERIGEDPSNVQGRFERVFWLATRLASVS